MNPFSLKNAKLMPLSKNHFTNEKKEKSNKKDISIIQEVKEKTPKKQNLAKSTLDIKNSRPKLQKNKSANFINFKQKLIPLGNEQKNKFSNILNNEYDKEKNKKGKEFYNKMSLERINFQFEEYGDYPNDDFQPSIYFFKFLANKPDYEKENKEKGKVCTSKLKLFIPDTIVLNDLDTNYWIYTDIEGYVNRVEESDNEVIEKFKPQNDKNELIAVSKMPIMRDGLLGENQLTLLNLEELEKCLFSKSGTQIAIQRFVK